MDLPPMMATAVPLTRILGFATIELTDEWNIVMSLIDLIDYSSKLSNPVITSCCNLLPGWWCVIVKLRSRSRCNFAHNSGRAFSAAVRWLTKPGTVSTSSAGWPAPAPGPPWGSPRWTSTTRQSILGSVCHIKYELKRVLRESWLK